LTVKKKLSLARKLLRWSVPSFWHDDTMGIAALHPSYELHPASSFRDGPKDQTSDVQLHIGESRDSGFDASHRPGMTASYAANAFISA
jgi:hypothetical protein